MNIERKYLIAISTYVPFGPARIGLLHNYFKSYKSAWNSSYSELLEIGLSKKLVDGFRLHRRNFSIDDYLSKLETKKIKVIAISDEDYPENLRNLANAPVVLYVVGNLKPQDKSAVAIVGTRKISGYGKEITSMFSSRLADYGVTIVSGLALGVDAVAHRSAIEVGGRCIAVLASGIDIVTPATNRTIAVEIIKRKIGAIVTEYPLGYPPAKENFPNRNRIISGLSKAILVPEGRIASGTIHTVNHAATQGKEVYAIPGPVTSVGSELPNYLIKTGAKVATTPEDLIKELNLQTIVDREEVERVLPSDNVEKKIVKLLEIEPLPIDEMARSLRISSAKLSAKLSIMELKGMIVNKGDEYKLVR